MFALPLSVYDTPGVGPAATSYAYYAGPAWGATQVGSYSSTAAGSDLANIINFHTGSRMLRWRFDLLHNNRTYKGDVSPFVAKATIQYDTSRAVKRSLQLSMVETTASQTVTTEGNVISSAGIDYLYDLIQPVCLIGVPGTSHWLQFPCGLFRFTRPGVSIPGFAVVREATMPDLTSIVQENAATDAITQSVPLPLTLPAGAYVLDAIRCLLSNQPNPTSDGTVFTLPGCALGDLLPSNAFSPGANPHNTPGDWPSTSTAPYNAVIPAGGYQVPEGQSYLELINHLAYTIQLNDLMADERGILRLYPWTVAPPSYTLPAPGFRYDTTVDSIVQMGVEESILLDDVCNVVEVVVEDTQRATFKAVATNDDPHSPYSLSQLGRRVVKTVHDGQVPDAVPGTSYVQDYAKDQLLRASWLTDQVTLPIAVNPLHCGGPDRDVVSLNIYQSHVEAGAGVDNPVIIGFTLAGGTNYAPLVVTESFVVDGWTISAALPQPGSSSNLTGGVGLTTLLEPRESKQGHVMTLTCHRITSTVRPAYVNVSS